MAAVVRRVGIMTFSCAGGRHLGIQAENISFAAAYSLMQRFGHEINRAMLLNKGTITFQISPPQFDLEKISSVVQALDVWIEAKHLHGLAQKKHQQNIEKYPEKWPMVNEGQKEVEEASSEMIKAKADFDKAKQAAEIEVEL